MPTGILRAAAIAEGLLFLYHAGMTQNQWLTFEKFRGEFREKCLAWNEEAQEIGLPSLVAKIAEQDTPFYEQETSVVYNRSLDELTAASDVRFVVIGDNPGKDEQLKKNRRYLVGQSGKLAERFFRVTSELDADFRRNALVLNKTPVHTAKTAHLRRLACASPEAARLLCRSQEWLACATAALHAAWSEESACQLWLVGYGELKKGGIFAPYREALAKSYQAGRAWQNVLVFQHFSMNRFAVDLRKHMEATGTHEVTRALRSLGEKHRNEIFGHCWSSPA